MEKQVTKKGNFFLKNLLIFLISGFLPKLLSFFLVPIYTNYLTTDQYGTADLLSTTVALLIPIFTLTIYDAVFRFSMDEKRNQKEVFSQSIKVVLIGTFLVSIVLTIGLFLHIKGFTIQYLFLMICMFFLESINNIVTRFCKAVNQVKIVGLAGIFNSFFVMICNILFLVVFRWGIEGYLLAYIIGQFVAVFICFLWGKLWRYFKIHSTRGLTKEMIKFSFPMIFSALAWWINNASDRYIITWLCGVSISGIYAVANKIPTLLSTVQTVFNQAWSISAIKEFDKEDKDGFIGSVYTNFSIVMGLATSAIILVNFPLAKVLYGTAFFSAWKYSPPLVIAIFFNGISLYLDGLFLAVNNTKAISICNIIGALINTILNFLLINFFGAYGAAISTMIGFGIGYFLRVLWLKKYINLKTKRWKTYCMLALLICQLIFSFFGLTLIVGQIVVFFAISLLYIKEIKNILKSFIFKIIRKESK